MIRVELDIFSGRENPKWEITGPMEQDIRLKLAWLRKQEEVREDHEYLVTPGYRGFKLSEPDGRPLADVWADTVLVYSDTDSEVYCYGDERLETTLLYAAREHVPSQILENIGWRVERIIQI